MKILFLVFFGLASAAAPALAAKVTAYGVEFDVPKGWVTEQGKSAVLCAPRKFKDRVVLVTETKDKPAPTKIGIEAWFSAKGISKVSLTDVKEGERNGGKQILAVGAAEVNGKPVQLTIVIIPTDTGTVTLTSYIAGEQDPAVIEADRKIILSARLAGANLKFTVVPPKSEGVVAAPKAFTDVLAKMVESLSKKIRLPRTLEIYVAECGTPNAYYSPSEHNIRICHEYFAFQQEVFQKAGFAAATAMAQVQKAMYFTFFHEFAHAMQTELRLPFTGKGEDAADDFAAILLANAGKFGVQAALAKLVYFELIGNQRVQDQYNDEHSLDLQRSASIACLLYGGNPSAYRSLLANLKFTKDRAAKCIREYHAKRDAYEKLLAPYQR